MKNVFEAEFFLHSFKGDNSVSVHLQITEGR